MAFTPEEKREIKKLAREAVGGTPLEQVEEVDDFESGDLVPFMKYDGDNDTYKTAKIAGTNIGSGGGGGGGEPSQYLKDASVSQDGNTLTLTKKNNSTVTFAPNTGGGTGTVTGVKVGSEGAVINPTQGVVTIPPYESGAQAHIAPTSSEVKNALDTVSTSQGRFLRDDGTWQTPPSGGGDVTGVKGDSESQYRTGNVNITKDNIGLGNVENKSTSTLKSEIMTEANVKDVLCTGSGITKYLREDGQWEVPSGTAPDPSTDIPPMDDSSGAVGTSAKYARADHKHPSDTSRVPTSRTVNGKPLSSNITLNSTDVGALPDTTEIITRDTTGLDNYYTKTATDSMLGTLNTNVSTAIQDASDAKDEAEQVRAELNAKQLEVGAVQTDSEPTKDSTNHVTSGAIYAYIDKFEDMSGLHNFKMAFVDSMKNLIFALGNDDVLHFYTDIEAHSITAESLLLTSNSQRTKSGIYERNKDKEGIIVNDALYDNVLLNEHPREKRFQTIVVTDTHEVFDSFQNAIDAANDFQSVDCVIQLGDMGYWLGEYDNYPTNKIIINNSTVPLYITAGNHDVGTRSSYVRYCANDRTLYERYVLPSVQKGYLKSGEYIDGKNYYYHDFTDTKVRLIMLYPYDDGNVLDDTYWESVTYNSSNPDIEAKTYNSGDVINVPYYNSCSFRVKSSVSSIVVENVTSPSGSAWRYENGQRVNYNLENNPRFKALRFLTWYGQTQLDWFATKLIEASTLGYSVVIGQHVPFIDADSTLPASGYHDRTTRFDNPYKTCINYYEYRYINSDRNIIAQIAGAYVNGETIQKTVYPYGKTNPSERKSVDIDYCGIDDASSIEPVTLNYNFSGITNGKVLMISGHKHSDYVVKSDVYNLTNLTFLSGTNYEVVNCDVMRNDNSPKIADTSTVMTVYGNTVHLTRLGIDATIRVGSDGRLIKKDNEVLTF